MLSIICVSFILLSFICYHHHSISFLYLAVSLLGCFVNIRPEEFQWWWLQPRRRWWRLDSLFWYFFAILFICRANKQYEGVILQLLLFKTWYARRYILRYKWFPGRQRFDAQGRCSRVLLEGNDHGVVQEETVRLVLSITRSTSSSLNLNITLHSTTTRYLDFHCPLIYIYKSWMLVPNNQIDYNCQQLAHHTRNCISCSRYCSPARKPKERDGQTKLTRQTNW